MSQVPTGKGLELSHLPSGREEVDGRSGHEPGHTEERVRLREPLPLPNTSQMLSEHLPSRPPGAQWERSSILSNRPLLLILSSVCGS